MHGQPAIKNSHPRLQALGTEPLPYRSLLGLCCVADVDVSASWRNSRCFICHFIMFDVVYCLHGCLVIVYYMCSLLCVFVLCCLSLSHVILCIVFTQLSMSMARKPATSSAISCRRCPRYITYVCIYIYIERERDRWIWHNIICYNIMTHNIT